MRTAARPVGVVAIVVGIVLAALLATYWLGGGAVGTGQGDPDSADPGGARAVTTLLRERGGKTVTTARGVGDLGATDGATLVVATPRKLSDDALGRLREAGRRANTLVLIRPHADTLAAFAPGVTQRGTADGVLRAQCRLPEIETGMEISGPTQLYDGAVDAPVGICFTQAGGGIDQPGALAWSRSGSGDRRVLVVGNLDMFTNARLAEVDNAAVALRLLGRDGRLTWYTGTAESAPTTGPATEKPWPPAWLGPLTLALAGVTAALMLWRGRRLGRLATEPLPVVVAANETTLARGRLYRRSKDPRHAARVLQDAVRRRLAAALAVSSGPASGGADRRALGPDAVAQAAARATGRPPQAVHDLLTRSPDDEKDLAALAEELARLDREVRHP